jgi:Spy/CpxP family protein refolding chaperone
MMGGMAQGMRSPMMRPGMGSGMMRNMERMPMDSTGWMQPGAGIRILESIPNVTDSQKKQIEDLIKKQHDDMNKLREDMSAKMKDMMTSHRKDMLNILTSEQKKFIENRTGRTENVK